MNHRPLVQTPSSPRARRGFTFVEVLTVFTVFGIVSLMAAPRLRGMREQAHLRSAKQHIAAYLTSARAAAIRRGRPATFAATADNRVSVTVDSSGVQVVLAPEFSINEVYSAALPGGATTVTFDRRGFAASLAATRVIPVSTPHGRDSVCVTRLGNILVDGCAP